MGRTCDIIGLTSEAKQWLNENCKLGKNNQPVSENSDNKLVTGWMDEQEYVFQIYTTTNGLKVEEFEQHEIWHSGPCHFFTLRFCHNGEAIEDSLWSDKDVGLA